MMKLFTICFNLVFYWSFAKGDLESANISSVSYISNVSATRSLIFASSSSPSSTSPSLSTPSSLSLSSSLIIKTTTTTTTIDAVPSLPTASSTQSAKPTVKIPHTPTVTKVQPSSTVTASISAVNSISTSTSHVTKPSGTIDNEEPSTSTVSHVTTSMISASPTTPVTTSSPTEITFPFPITTKPKTDKPTRPTPKVFIKRVYTLNVTTKSLKWNKDFTTNMMIAITVLAPQLELIRDKIGSVLSHMSDYNVTEYISENVLDVTANDEGFTRIHFRIKYKSADAGAQDPEVVLKENLLKGTFEQFSLVKMTIKEAVRGVKLGEWKSTACWMCCEQKLRQSRTCSTVTQECSGVITIRDVPCHWNCPLKCRTERMFSFNVTLTSHAWKEGYSNNQSDDFKAIVEELFYGGASLFTEVHQLFSATANFTNYQNVANDTLVLTKHGDKLRVLFKVVFGKPPLNAEDPEALFRFETDNGKLGKFTIDTESIEAIEHVDGYTFTEWKTVKDGCSTCCGGEVTQTRTCTARVGTCTSAQVERKIRCKHVCTKVECSGSSGLVANLFLLLILLWTLFV